MAGQCNNKSVMTGYINKGFVDVDLTTDTEQETGDSFRNPPARPQQQNVAQIRAKLDETAEKIGTIRNELVDSFERFKVKTKEAARNPFSERATRIIEAQPILAQHQAGAKDRLMWQRRKMKQKLSVVFGSNKTPIRTQEIDYAIKYIDKKLKKIKAIEKNYSQACVHPVACHASFRDELLVFRSRMAELEERMQNLPLLT